MTDLPRLLDIGDLAKVLGVSEKSIYQRRHRRGALPPVTRLGRSLRWRPQDVEQWLANQTEHQPTS